MFSRIFHFVTRDYFRYRDESSDDSDSEDEEEEQNDFVVGGICSPSVLTAQNGQDDIAALAADEIKKYEILKNEK